MGAFCYFGMHVNLKTFTPQCPPGPVNVWAVSTLVHFSLLMPVLGSPHPTAMSYGFGHSVDTSDLKTVTIIGDFSCAAEGLWVATGRVEADGEGAITTGGLGLSALVPCGG